MFYRLVVSVDFDDLVQYMASLEEIENDRHASATDASSVSWFRPKGVTYDSSTVFEPDFLLVGFPSDEIPEFNNLTVEDCPVYFEVRCLRTGPIVIAGCRDDQLETAFRSLLLAIADRFPEVKDQLRRHGFDFQQQPVASQVHEPGPPPEGATGTVATMEEGETPPGPHPSLVELRGFLQDKQAVLKRSEQAREDYYEPATACAVADALVKAKKQAPYKTLGPKLVSEYCVRYIHRQTVGDYFTIFRELGVESVEGVTVYKGRSSQKSS